MFKLIKLEMKKNKIGGFIKGALIADFVIIGMLLIIILGTKSDGELPFDDYNMAFMLMGTMVKATFIVFASVMLSRFVIEEYKTGTITLLFMYPINRKKLLWSKLIIIFVFTLIFTFISNVFADGMVIVLNNFCKIVPDKLTKEVLIYNFISICTNTLTTAGMSLIPLYFGMIKKSVQATIISSLLIVTIICTNNNGVSLNNIIAVTIALAVVGVLIAYLTIRNIEHIDATN